MQTLWNRINFLLKPAGISLCILICNSSQGQFKWDGEGNDAQWINPLNWNMNALPGTGDEVVLDNSVVSGNYVVKLPAGAVTVTIGKLIIDPGDSDSITLLLPKENIAIPGLQISGPGYGLILNRRSVFINASGAASGLPVMISDSICINNGGRYIHRTGRSHAANISVLAAIPGTESGIFEFDLPEASGTISLSDRVFGTLILSAATAGRQVSYTAAGTRRILVRSDFVLNPTVALNLNFSDTFFVEGNYIQYGSTFNCGTTARTLIILIRGDFLQFSGGLITETGTGLPELLIKGSGLQQLRNEGVIANSVSMKIESSDCNLQTPLRLPYSLKLTKGRMHTTDSTLLILGPGCALQADSSGGRSFVDGPMVKEGLGNEHFLFPVGKGISMRWLALKNVSGNVRVEFIKSNPQLMGALLGPGIHHISSIEHWKVSDHLLTGGNVELSFDDVNSGGVTELSSLRVAIFEAGKWQNAGNSFTTGNAGGAGSVISNNIGESGTGDRYFTLAAASSSQNPLPYFNIQLSGVSGGNHILLKWTIAPELYPEFFEIEASTDGRNFYKRGRVNSSGNANYSFRDATDQFDFYRLRSIFRNGENHLSETIHLSRLKEPIITIGPSIVREFLQIKINRYPEKTITRAWIVSRSGNVVYEDNIGKEGSNAIYTINTRNLTPGLYYLVLSGKTFPFIKL